jgi:hypothetical protein
MENNLEKIKFKQWDCIIQYKKYKNNRTAICLVDSITFEPIAIATTNIPEVPIKDNEVIIKDYSENEGILETLVNANIISKLGKNVKIGHVKCEICKLVKK